MAARKQNWHPDAVREKIQASQLVNRLQKHAHGKVKMEATQVQAALGLLDRCVPRLAAVEHSGEVTQNIVTAEPISESEWQTMVAPPASSAMHDD